MAEKTSAASSAVSIEVYSMSFAKPVPACPAPDATDWIGFKEPIEFDAVRHHYSMGTTDLPEKGSYNSYAYWNGA